MPPPAVAPGNGAPFGPFPPPSILVAAVGKRENGVVDDVEDVAFATCVELPVCVEFPDAVVPFVEIFPLADEVTAGVDVIVITVFVVTVDSCRLDPSTILVMRDVDNITVADGVDAAVALGVIVYKYEQGQ